MLGIFFYFGIYEYVKIRKSLKVINYQGGVEKVVSYRRVLY